MDTNIGDLILWKAFKTGDEVAFSELYRQHAKALHLYGQKISADHAVVEDAIQDLFVDIWKSRQNLADPDSVKYYLFRILRRKISRILTASHPTEQLEDYDLDPASQSEAFENEIIRMEGDEMNERKIQAAIRHLSLRQQEAINLRYFHNFSPAQIAELMGISIQSVHNTLQKAMKSLREALDRSTKRMVSLTGLIGLLFWQYSIESTIL